MITKKNTHIFMTIFAIAFVLAIGLAAFVPNGSVAAATEPLGMNAANPIARMKAIVKIVTSNLLFFLVIIVYLLVVFIPMYNARIPLPGEGTTKGL